MLQQSALENLEAWWQEIAFPGKDLYTLNENGALTLKVLREHKERVITTFSAENAAVLFKALTDKFQEVVTRVAELKLEWESAEDKQKLHGKVERLNDYLQHASAIGDYEALFATVQQWEGILNATAENNYNTRMALVQQAEELAASDSWKETTQAYRDLAEKWKQAGYLAKNKSDELWNRIEAARQKFYDRKRDHQEKHDQEMLRNLDVKMGLAEQAEGLALSEDWKETSEVYRKLMDEWKATGRTTNDKNEALWNRFITAKNTFYDRKKLHFERIQQEQDNNYVLKTALAEKAEALKDSTTWGPTMQAMAAIMDEWKAIGRVPQEKGDELWNRMNAARDQFFQAKKNHFDTVKVSQDDNMARKRAILKRADTLKGSTDWRNATEEMNELMAEWKTIGPVAREHSNAIWEQFLAARKHFFGRKDAHRDERKKQAEQQISQRTEQVRTFITKLEEEIKEEEYRIADFRNGLENITPGRKEHELRSHLENLISQAESSISRKAKKLEEVKLEIENKGAANKAIQE